MSAALTLHLRADATVTTPAPDRVVVGAGRQAIQLAAPRAGLRAALDRLAASGDTADGLRAIVLERDGMAALFTWEQALQRLHALGLVDRVVALDAQPIARLTAVSGRCATVAAPVAPDTAWCLSRFALLRRDGATLVAESPLGHAVVRLIDPRAAALAGAFGTSSRVSDRAVASGLPAEVAGWVVAVLAAAAVVVPATEDGLVEERDPVLAQWEVADLYFHSRSRLGRRPGAFGGTFRFVGGPIPPTPVFKPTALRGDAVALPRADVGTLAATDPPFQQVMERRASVREHGDRPIDATALGEFLWRTARVTEHLDNEHGEVAHRVYPGGGAIYELEVYPVVDRCDGVTSGLWRYDPRAHVLEPVAGRTPAVQQLLDTAYYTADQRARPHVLLVLTARFQRMQWKYEGMAYAAILKHVGVVYQTFYLAATAMGLAPCALGGGDADLFAEAAGLDWRVETSVGEFILGRAAGA